MSYNGSGTFVINTAGQPVVPNTVISATAFNALTADLANGLSTCITKDGQTTPTANIPMGNNKITGLAAGTAGTDAANLSQVQGSTAKLLQSVTGTDTITAAMVPALTAYSAGQMFYFVAAGDNTGAVTINIDSLGAKNVTRDGSTALVAGDITNGKVVVIVYDGTRFQLLNSNAFTNLYVSGNLGVGNNTPAYKFHVERPSYGITGYFYANDGTRNPRLVIYGSSAGTTLQHTYSTGADALIFANGGSIGAGTEVGRFDGSGNLGIGTATMNYRVVADCAAAGNNDNGFAVRNTNSSAYGGSYNFEHAVTGGNSPVRASFISSEGGSGNSFMRFATTISGTLAERMRISSAGDVGIGTASPTYRVDTLLGAGSGNIARFGQSGVSNGYTITTSGTALTHEWATAGSVSMRIDANGNIVAGTSVALATNATNGFLYVPTCAGTPTGTPTAITGMAPIVVDTTNNKMYFYSGGVWRDAGP